MHPTPVDRVDRYAHLSRLLEPGDFDFLANSKRGYALIECLKQKRLCIAALYMRQLRCDFRLSFHAASEPRIWVIARFCWLYAELWVRLSFRRYLECPIDWTPLLKLVQRV